MDILWTTAFIDMGEDTFEAGVEFWTQTLGCTVSPRRGDTGEFATLVPPDGDPYVRVQRTLDGSSGMHLDLHVRSPQGATARASHLGATLVSKHGAEDEGYVVMRSPGGLIFCFVGHRGESVVPQPHGRRPHRFDQVCIDVAAAVFDEECAFWSGLTGWALAQSELSEFRSLERPDGIPLRFLLQRLDTDPSSHQPHAHIDIACGAHIDDIADEHVALGATPVGRLKVWMQMRDPAGLAYCLTPRAPQPVVLFEV